MQQVVFRKQRAPGMLPLQRLRALFDTTGPLRSDWQLFRKRFPRRREPFHVPADSRAADVEAVATGRAGISDTFYAVRDDGMFCIHLVPDAIVTVVVQYVLDIVGKVGLVDDPFADDTVPFRKQYVHDAAYLTGAEIGFDVRLKNCSPETYESVRARVLVESPHALRIDTGTLTVYLLEGSHNAAERTGWTTRCCFSR